MSKCHIVGNLMPWLKSKLCIFITFQVSQFSTDLSSIEVTRNDSSENDTSSPIIQTLQMPVGFGNDVHNSKTVDMLKVLTEKLGYIRSFTGAEFADDITLELPA